MYCIVCGAYNPDENLYCQHCGSRLAQDQNDSTVKAEGTVSINEGFDSDDRTVATGYNNTNSQNDPYDFEKTQTSGHRSSQSGNFTNQTEGVGGYGGYRNYPNSTNPVGNGYDGEQNKSNTKLILIICITLVSLIAVGVGGFFLLSSIKTEESSVRSKSSSVTERETERESSREETTAKPEKKKFNNIINETDELTEEEMSDIQELAEEKSDTTGLKIILDIGGDLDSNIERYAENKCKSNCGKNGVYIAIDTENYSSAIGISGNAKKYVTNSVKKEIIDCIDDKVMDGQYFKACTQAIKKIPDKADESLAFGFDEVVGAEQVIYVKKNSGSNTGKLTLVDWSGDEPRKLYEISTVYLGMDGITSSPSEYKNATPKGTFKLGFALSDHYLDTNLDTKLISSGAVWVNDSNSNYYNTLQYGSTSNSSWSSAEDVYANFKKGYYEACILIEHNGDGYTRGTPGKGSAMFISGKSQNVGTSYGDVNVTTSQIKTLLSHLDSDKNPHIVIS